MNSVVAGCSGNRPGNLDGMKEESLSRGIGLTNLLYTRYLNRKLAIPGACGRIAFFMCSRKRFYTKFFTGLSIPDFPEKRPDYAKQKTPPALLYPYRNHTGCGRLCLFPSLERRRKQL